MVLEGSAEPGLGHCGDMIQIKRLNFNGQNSAVQRWFSHTFPSSMARLDARFVRLVDLDQTFVLTPTFFTFTLNAYCSV